MSTPTLIPVDDTYEETVHLPPGDPDTCEGERDPARTRERQAVLRAELTAALKAMYAVNARFAEEIDPFDAMIAAHQAEIERIVALRDEAAQPRVSRLAHLQERAEMLFAAWLNAEKDLRGERAEKTLRTPYGTVSGTDSLEWSWPEDPEDIKLLVKALMDAGLADLVRTKHEELPEKVRIKKLVDDELPTVRIDPDSGRLVLPSGESVDVFVSPKTTIHVRPSSPR